MCRYNVSGVYQCIPVLGTSPPGIPPGELINKGKRSPEGIPGGYGQQQWYSGARMDAESTHAINTSSNGRIAAHTQTGTKKGTGRRPVPQKDEKIYYLLKSIGAI